MRGQIILGQRIQNIANEEIALLRMAVRQQRCHLRCGQDRPALAGALPDAAMPAYPAPSFAL